MIGLKNVLIWALLFCVSVFSAGCAKECGNNAIYPADISYEGHRMATKSSGHSFPHNSLESLKDLIASEVSTVEFDVRSTRDNELIIMHDSDTCSYGEKNVVISKTMLSEIPRMKGGFKVPTMQEVVGMLEGRRFATVLVDMKAAGSDSIKRFEDLVKDLIIDHDKVVILYDYSDRTLRKSMCDIAYRNGIEVQNYKFQVICR
ncbi:glycerophosphodiester phosphodiesterase [Bdellovibrio bacteriovorus]|uniref:glycerophosphodiester phosphodiesterase n=1 Tax=Bdellovibrio bacteriovorus TaxID=959 RepID=UPI003A7FE2C8